MRELSNVNHSQPKPRSYDTAAAGTSPQAHYKVQSFDTLKISQNMKYSFNLTTRCTFFFCQTTRCTLNTLKQGHNATFSFNITIAV